MKNRWTISEVAKNGPWPRHAVKYVIRARNIAPVETVAGIGLFVKDQVAVINDQLELIARNRRARTWRVHDESVLAVKP
jgi:hypothetical protein